MASVKVILLKNKMLASGECPLAVRIIKDRKIKYVFLGHYLHPEDWDEQAREVKKSHPNSQRLNLLLKQKSADAEGAILDFENQDRQFNLDTIKKKVQKRSAGMTFFEFAKLQLEQLEQEKRFNALASERSRIKNLRKFNKDRELQFQDCAKSVKQVF